MKGESSSLHAASRASDIPRVKTMSALAYMRTEAVEMRSTSSIIEFSSGVP